MDASPCQLAHMNLNGGSWKGGGGYKSHFPAQILSKSHFPAWFSAKSQSQQWNFREIPVHRKSKLKHCQYVCAVRILIFRLSWSVWSPSVTNTMNIKFWVHIGRLNMFPLRSAPWVDDVMWHGNYVIASSGCHHESTLLDFLIFPWQTTKIDPNFIKLIKRIRMLNDLKVEGYYKKTNLDWRKG